MFDPGDLEGLVDQLYERLGYSRDDAKRPSTLARLLYGPKSLQYVPHMRAQGHCGMLNGAPLIVLRSGQSRARQEDTIGHEMWHIETGVGHGECQDAEFAADYFSAALQMPRRAYQKRINRVGADWTQLALDFGVTQTSACLRAGEVEGRAIAVVANVVRARGDMQRHTEREIRGFVRQPAPGVVSARLNDERGRWVVEGRWAEAG